MSELMKVSPRHTSLNESVRTFFNWEKLKGHARISIKIELFGKIDFYWNRGRVTCATDVNKKIQVHLVGYLNGGLTSMANWLMNHLQCETCKLYKYISMYLGQLDVSLDPI